MCSCRISTEWVEKSENVSFDPKNQKSEFLDVFNENDVKKKLEPLIIIYLFKDLEKRD